MVSFSFLIFSIIFVLSRAIELDSPQFFVVQQQKPPTIGYILDNHIDTDRGFWLNAFDLTTGELKNILKVGINEQFAYEQAVWRLDKNTIMLITNNFLTGQQNISTLDLGTNELSTIKTITAWWQTAVLDNSRGKIFTVYSPDSSSSVVVDIDPVSGLKGSLAVQLMGGVPAFNNYQSAYDSIRSIFYLVGFYGGPLKRDDIVIQDPKVKRDCYQGGCSYLYTVDIKQGVQTDLHFIEDSLPISSLVYDIKGDQLLVFSIEMKGNLKVSRMNPSDTSSVVIADITEIKCSVDLFEYDETTGFIVFTATPTCEGSVSVFVIFDPKTTQYSISKGTEETSIATGSSLFV